MSIFELVFIFEVIFLFKYVLHLEAIFILARAVGFPVGRRSGGRLPMMLVATITDIIIFSPPLSTFLIEGLLGSKNLFKLMGASKNLGIQTFQDPGGHLGAP